MDNSENLFEIQNRLFEEIKKNIPQQYALVDVVSEVLNTSSDSAYRRIRCDKLLNIKETYTLCKHFGISFDLLTDVKSRNQFNCIYRPINLSTISDYHNYIVALSTNFGRLRTIDDSNILLSAADIPVFHLISQKELTLFKLYTWSHSVNNYEIRLDDFIKEIETSEIVSYHQKIVRDYELISSSEIWTENTINTTLRLISYYVDICKFPNKDLPLLLCEQVLNILNKLQKWAENSSKGEHKTPFQFYVSEMALENTYVLMRQSEQTSCLVKLFTINSLNVLDKEFCRETENWLNKLSQRSALLCGNSEKERIKFFNTQRQNVRFLMEKIQKAF